MFAAASTAGLLEELAEDFRKETGIEMRLSTAGSSTLARQIEQGAPAELFISADPQWVSWLEGRGGFSKGRSCDWLGNELVLIGRKGLPREWRRVRGHRFPKALPAHIALGDPSHVPVGRYAKEALTWLGVWEELRTRVVPAMDASATLQLVASGACELGVVYASDALRSSRVQVLLRLPAESHRKIRYELVETGRGGAEAGRFYEFLTRQKARERIRKHGFVPLVR